MPLRAAGKGRQYLTPEQVERGRQVGFHDYVAKFDRPGLIAALKEQTGELHRAA